MLFDKKKDKVKFDIVPKTNKEYISVTYGCIRFIDSYRFSTNSLHSLVKTWDTDDFELFEDQFPNKREH